MIDRARQRPGATAGPRLGLAAAMKALFDELRRTMQTVATESERIRKLVRETYQIFRDDFGFDLATPKVFVPMKYRVEIELLYQEVEAFRRSPTMVLASPGRVIRRFDQQMVSRAQVLFDQLRIAYDGWIRDTLQPLAEEIQEHKAMMEKRLENLQRIGRSKDAPADSASTICSSSTWASPRISRHCATSTMPCITTHSSSRRPARDRGWSPVDTASRVRGRRELAAVLSGRSPSILGACANRSPEACRSRTIPRMPPCPAAPVLTTGAQPMPHA